MRSIVTLIFACLGTSAMAHPGHWAELAGHDHWVAGAAIGLAILLGLRGAMKGRDQDPQDANADPESDPDGADTEEAAA